MTPEAWIVVGCVVGALVLFATERLPPEGVGVLVLLVLGLTGTVDAPTAFAGFASPAVITNRWVWAETMIIDFTS